MVISSELISQLRFYTQSNTNGETVMNKIKLCVAVFLSGAIGLIGPAISSAASDTPPSINGEARVVRVVDRYVTVIEQRPVEECRNVTVKKSGSTSSDTPELLGLLIGGAIGKELDDDGNSNTGATIGAILGASIASDMEKKNAQQKGTTTTEVQCATVNREVEVQRVDGYDVTYEYDNQLFTWKMKYRPGSTIPVKIYVLPDE